MPRCCSTSPIPKDGYTAEKIRRMYGSGERDIQLNTPIPVHITYQTAFVDDAGQLVFREDVYGRDSRLLAALKGEDRRIADVPVEHREAAAGPKRQAQAAVARMPIAASNRRQEDFTSSAYSAEDGFPAFPVTSSTGNIIGQAGASGRACFCHVPPLT